MPWSVNSISNPSFIKIANQPSILPTICLSIPAVFSQVTRFRRNWQKLKLSIFERQPGKIIGFSHFENWAQECPPTHQ
jgi:hypothetical protein